MAATLAAILNETPPDVSTLLGNVPAELDALFRSALARDPLQRPASVIDWTETVANRLELMAAGDAGWPLPITHELSVRQSPAAEPR